MQGAGPLHSSRNWFKWRGCTCCHDAVEGAKAEMQFQAVAKVIANFGGRCYLMGDHHPLYKDSFTATRGMPDKQLIFTTRAGDFKFRRVLMRPARRNHRTRSTREKSLWKLPNWSGCWTSWKLFPCSPSKDPLSFPDSPRHRRQTPVFKKIRRVLSQEVNSWELPAILRCKRAGDGSL